MPLWILGPALVISTAVASLAGLWLVRRSVPASALREHHDVAGFIIAVLGVIYAVLLALVTIAVWEQFQAAQATVAHEANGLANVFRTARGLPAPVQRQIRQRARAYARLMADEEWEMLARGKDSPRARQTLDQLWGIYENWNPRTNREVALYGQSLDALNELSSGRRLRLLESREGIPGVMWTVLILGGVLTVVFTYLFGVENVRVQALMTALLASEVALVLLLISSLNYAFSGDLRVSPEPFVTLQQRMDEIELHERVGDAALKSR